MAESDFWEVRVRGLSALTRDLDRADARFEHRLSRGVRELAEAVEPIFRAHAPVDTGATRESITTNVDARGRLMGFRVEGGAVRGDFPYLNVTRFGHHKAFITPRRAKQLKVHYLGHRHPEVFVKAGRVRGYRPASDWVENAQAEAEFLIFAAEERLGRAFHSVYLD